MKKLMAVAMVMALACGCASNGRVAVVDWDSREAAQIQAAQYEAGCIYGDELDGYDETLCMYDMQVPDDEMWDLLCRAVPAGVRVVLISDACHSETAFRDGPPTGWRKDAGEFKGRLLALSGCADDMVSWGGSSGGKFTAALDHSLRNGISYRDWFAAAARDMGRGQVPKMVEIGESFADMEALT